MSGVISERKLSDTLWMMMKQEVCGGTCRWGHAASRVGSSSSGSNSAPVGLDEGGRVLNMFTANCNTNASRHWTSSTVSTCLCHTNESNTSSAHISARDKRLTRGVDLSLTKAAIANPIRVTRDDHWSHGNTTQIQRYRCTMTFWAFSRHELNTEL